LSKREPPDVASLLARKAEGDAKAMRRLASDPEIEDDAVGLHAQQAIEKWIKAVMALNELDEQRIHDLGRLAQVLEEAGIDPPPGADWFDSLSIYAGRVRYADLLELEPLEREPVVALVGEVGDWAEAQRQRAER
jgi:HEPN domain-containing protein